MTIQRQYNLPNCKLVLEGFEDSTPSADAPAARPPLSVLTNVECHLVGYEKPLTGGREFLESLASAVSGYAQEFLSGVYHPTAHSGKPGLVQLQKVSEDLHRLTVQPQGVPDSHASAPVEPVQMDLRTVQLFDLVEAIDQFFADTQTLPALSLNLEPVSKRYVTAQEPVSKRVIPAAVGLSGLAVAAIALFYVPIPQPRQPEPKPTGQESSVPSPTPAAPPTPAGSGSPSPTTPTPSPSSALQENNMEALLKSAPEITSVETLDRLTENLRKQLSREWERQQTFQEELVYRVGVAENGDVLGFKYVNSASIDYVDETPLPNLRYNPTSADVANPEPIAQFRVVFTPKGVVEVSPWYGRPPEPSPTP